MTTPAAPNLLAESGLPIGYAVTNSPDGHWPPADEDFAVAIRTIVRSLTVMQKEATVVSSRSGTRWRLSSDEGPYLQGHDWAPAPLAYMTVGLAADLMSAIRRSLDSIGVETSAMSLTLDTRFTMEGSMRARTMRGGALSPEVTVHMPDPAGDGIRAAVEAGVRSSATAGLSGPRLTSEFSLTNRGRAISAGNVAGTTRPLSFDPGSEPEMPPVSMDTLDEPLIVKTRDVADEPVDAGVGLRDTQHRGLHLQAEAATRPDGLTEVSLHVHSPNGSTFKFLSEEPDAGMGRAPDSLTYISAGLGFCFMTQIGRFAKIVKEELGPYHIVQDTRFSVGSVGEAGRVAAPVTHVYLAPDGDDDFAREALAMSEQTCFLHALCRTELEPIVKLEVA